MANLKIRRAVGKGCPNEPKDVKAVHKSLMEAGIIPCFVNNGDLDDRTYKGILDVQSRFMKKPDGVISVGKTTNRFLSEWKDKPISTKARLPGRLRVAWDLVSPLLPAGSYCTSGYRSADDQRRVLHQLYRGRKLKPKIVQLYGQAKYDAIKSNLAKNEKEVLAMVRATGQKIATPGRSKHQFKKAIDVGGAGEALDKRQVAVIRMVARANPGLFSGTVIKERNGCVHFELA